MDAQPCPPKEHETTVTLRNLNPSLNFPKVDKISEILAGDYGRETDFAILHNRERSPLRLDRGEGRGEVS